MYDDDEFEEPITVEQLQTLRGYVTQGADLLDRMEPGWLERVDLGTLDIINIKYCVLGQVFGYYETGLVRMEEWSGFTWAGEWFRDRNIVRDHGFTTFTDGTVTGDWSRDMAILQEMWRELIIKRRQVQEV